MHKTRIYFLSLFAFTICLDAHAQQVVFDMSKVKQNSNISVLKFYISAISLHCKDNTTYLMPQKAILINALDSNKNNFNLMQHFNSEVDSITFNIGIDSLTNVSGAYEGDLDPMNNMYWTWQSGYINLKLEGAIDDGLYREYHLGGYANPNNALQKVSLKVNDAENIMIYIHLDDFIHSIPDSIPFKLMTPCPKAVYLAHLFAKCLSNEK